MVNKWTVISTSDDSYNISAIIVDDKYKIPSLNFNIDGKCVDCWDHEEYLIKTVYPYLKGEISDENLDEYFSNLKPDILELFEEAIKMNFFKK